MTEPAQSIWAGWAQQLPALGMILVFLWFTVGKLVTGLNAISENCHKTQRDGHIVISAATTAMGASTESNREVRALMAEVKVLLIKKNGSRQ